ncbi:MAG: IclR family transcriptional regulator [Gammaproteobacteria bacterium]|nr:IclR family transcriptional regulator [Gammaproteobacteria bacterium]
MSSDNEKKNHPTILRGLIVLEKVIEAGRPISGSELIEQLELPKPTVNRILQQLEESGLLLREPGNRRYMPGLRARQMAIGVMTNSAVGAPRHAILKALSEEIGETCNCTMLDGDHTVYFDRVEANWPFRIQLPVGSQMPLHCTASGKLFLAHMESRQRRRLISAAPLKRYTERTITDPELLLNELKNTEKDGIGVDNEELMTGMVAVAVPVFNQENKICFTLAVHAPTARKSLEELRQYLPSLRRAAASMSTIYCNPGDAEE